MSKNTDINDLEEGFVILGGTSDFFQNGRYNSRRKRLPWWLWVIMGIVVLAIAIFFIYKITSRTTNGELQPSLYSVKENVKTDIWYNNTDAAVPPCSIVSDTLIGSIQLQIITPYNAVPELHVGKLDSSDNDIVFATLAADIRQDNGKIVGAFVNAGEPLAWGLSKRGYCAIIEGNITLGVAENSPFFEQATEQSGYFFRQYPAVDKGVMVENNPKNASYRRALCMLNGKVCIIATPDRVLMNDFSSALATLGVENAIFLIGGDADGWYRTADGTFHRLGEKFIKDNPNINYIVFRAQ
ncbi:MAG: hypothetical protein IJ986_06875 [Bacteroidales bacterium]|nr:hypothetical protein [Bacteroidales bacterium]